VNLAFEEQVAEAADKLDHAPFEQMIMDRMLSQDHIHSGWKTITPFIFYDQKCYSNIDKERRFKP